MTNLLNTIEGIHYNDNHFINCNLRRRRNSCGPRYKSQKRLVNWSHVSILLTLSMNCIDKRRINYRIPLQKYLKDFSAARRENNRLNGEDVKKMLTFSSLIDILPRTSKPALIGCGGAGGGSETRPLTHFRLVEFISNEFNLKKFGLDSKDRVGVCLPQGLFSYLFCHYSFRSSGPELVVCLLATVSYCSCIPINPSGTQDEIQFELGNVGAKAVIYLEEDSAHIKRAALNLGITSIYLRPVSSSLFPQPSTQKNSKIVTSTNHHVNFSQV